MCPCLPVMRPLIARIIPSSVRSTFSRSSKATKITDENASVTNWQLPAKTLVGDEIPMSRREASLLNSTATTIDAETDPETPPLQPNTQNGFEEKQHEVLVSSRV